MFQLVNKDGWLREHVFQYCKSGNIWSGDASQLPFKAEITPQVAKLLSFIGVCLFLGIFPWF